MQTQLVINRGGFPPFSARGCKQTLQPRINGELRRTINGDLFYTGQKQPRKYVSTITCHDETSPALEGLWRGESVMVQCIQRLSQEVEVPFAEKQVTVTLERSAVAGSIDVMNQVGQDLKFTVKDRRTLDISMTAIPGTGDDEAAQELRIAEMPMCIFISYRPILKMHITKFQLHTDEWQQKCTWRLDLEEA